MVTIVNVVIASLNALALGGSLCDPITSSSCFSLPSSVQSNIIRSVYVRVRSFVAGVRRVGRADLAEPARGPRERVWRGVSPQEGRLLDDRQPVAREGRADDIHAPTAGRVGVRG